MYTNTTSCLVSIPRRKKIRNNLSNEALENLGSKSRPSLYHVIVKFLCIAFITLNLLRFSLFSTIPSFHTGPMSLGTALAVPVSTVRAYDKGHQHRVNLHGSLVISPPGLPQDSLSQSSSLNYFSKSWPHTASFTGLTSGPSSAWIQGRGPLKFVLLILIV